MEIPYVQAFFLLQENNALLQECKLTTLTLIHTSRSLLSEPPLAESSAPSIPSTNLFYPPNISSISEKITPTA